ncbi:MAG: dienelactone hydrolase family protein [Thermoanaerobaculia bacterium]|nr:dienelactone hydrolase family protein [Thermoanaerobaculia bacterium]
MELAKRVVSLSLLLVVGLGCAKPAAQESAAPAGEVAAADEHGARMQHEHAGEAPVATPAAEVAPRQEVLAQDVVYADLDGTPVQGHLVRLVAAEGPLPGLIVIQEWWGLNDNVRAMAARFAGEGYVVLAVDLYEGATGATAEEAAALMGKAMENPARLAANLRQAHAHLKESAGATKVGVVGWCFGGGWSLATALDLGSGIDAAVMYYGRTIDDKAELAKLEAPLLGLFGGVDEGIPLAGVRSMEAALAELGKQAEIVVYDGADHAFANPSGGRYDEAAASDSWKRTTEFFARHLR